MDPFGSKQKVRQIINFSDTLILNEKIRFEKYLLGAEKYTHKTTYSNSRHHFFHHARKLMIKIDATVRKLFGRRVRSHFLACEFSVKSLDQQYFWGRNTQSFQVGTHDFPVCGPERNAESHRIQITNAYIPQVSCVKMAVLMPKRPISKKKSTSVDTLKVFCCCVGFIRASPNWWPPLLTT